MCTLKVSAAVLLVAVFSVANAADDDVYGIPGKQFCLKDVCIGDPLSKFPEGLASLKAKKEFTDPLCKRGRHSWYTAANKAGERYYIQVTNIPGMAGKGVGEYYRVDSVNFYYGSELTQPDQKELMTTLNKRMELSPSSAPYSGKKFPDSIYLQLAVMGTFTSLGISDVTHYLDNVKPMEKQPSCTGKAPKI